MSKPLFTGVCTALVTPFLNNKINHPMVKVLLERQLSAGIEAVVLAGTTGEASTLSDDEKIQLFCTGKEYVKGEMKIIAGTGTNSTEHTVKLSVAAQQSGADALLIVSPYYNKATPQGLIEHYSTIAKQVNIPIIVYNVPSRTGLDMDVDVYKELSRIPNIVGVKEASTDIGKILEIRSRCPNFTVWSGNDDMTVPIISLGGQGVISVTSNVLPIEMNAMTKAALDGDFDTAAHLQCRLRDVTKLMFCELSPIPVKQAMSCIGYDCGGCRLPLGRITKENQKRIQEYFQ